MTATSYTAAFPHGSHWRDIADNQIYVVVSIDGDILTVRDHWQRLQRFHWRHAARWWAYTDREVKS